MIDPKDICFIGLGASASMYYRCLLPAHGLGADYAGFGGEPPDTVMVTGMVKGRTQRPDLTSYRAVVLQQPRGKGWLEAIKGLQAVGVTVLYEVDDWLHAIHNQPDHDFRDAFGKADLTEYERCMKAVDGLIVSTPWLAAAYKSFNRKVWVCENGIDPERYAYTRPERKTVNIGWAGATGHTKAAIPWMQATALAMLQRDQTSIVTIGQAFANGFIERFGEDRCLAIPWCAIEQYPAAMTMFDIALAPAGKGGFFKAKSDLRWLEASALGIPVIGDPSVYRRIEHGNTGFLADTPAQVTKLLLDLIDDPDLRTSVGEEAREHVLAERSYKVTCQQWADAIEQAVEANPRS